MQAAGTTASKRSAITRIRRGSHRITLRLVMPSASSPGVWLRRICSQFAVVRGRARAHICIYSTPHAFSRMRANALRYCVSPCIARRIQ